MARKRKPKRREGFFYTHGFSSGAVFACSPKRKPSTRKIKEDGIEICPDGAIGETNYSPTEWLSWDVEQRVRMVTVMANRMNTRRAIREIVLPELEGINERLKEIQDRLDAMGCCRNC